MSVPSETIEELRRAIRSGRTTAVALLAACRTAVEERDAAVHAVIHLNDGAWRDAHAIDTARAAAGDRALTGIPIFVKDNIAVTGTPTTAGSRALRDSTPDDAPSITRLRNAGAIIAAKTNLSEWANFRSAAAVDGWSAVGGQTRNPHDPARTPGGSSSGSAAAVAAGLVPAAIGTETNGSILNPAGTCGAVGLKPTTGAVSTAGVVPISPRQDVLGPITRTVADAATVYSVLAATTRPDLTDRLLKPRPGTPIRLALWAPRGASPAATEILLTVARHLERHGTVLEPVELETAPFADDMYTALLSEFREAIDGYLARAPGSRAHDLAELIGFNTADPVELVPFGQDLFEHAVRAPEPGSAKHLLARRTATMTARRIVDDALGSGRTAVLTVTNEPAPRIGDPDRPHDLDTAAPAAAAGYPAVTVPAGRVDGLPVGVTLIGRARGESRLLETAYLVERLVSA